MYVKLRVPRVKVLSSEHGIERVLFVPIGGIGSADFIEKVNGKPMVSVTWDDNCCLVSTKEHAKDETSSERPDGDDLYDIVPAESVEFVGDGTYCEQYMPREV